MEKNTQRKSKRILAGMLAFLMAYGTAPANFGGYMSAAASETSSADPVVHDEQGVPAADEGRIHDKDNENKPVVSGEEHHHDHDDPAAVIDTDAEETEYTSADESSAVSDADGSDEADEETTAEETVITIAPDVDIPLGAEIIINADDHFYDGEDTVRVGDLLTTDTATLEYESYDSQHGYGFRIGSRNNSSLSIGFPNNDSSLTPLGIKCVSGNGTKNDPYKFEAVFMKKTDPKDNEEPQAAGGFIGINSIEEAVTKMIEVTPDKAKAWLADNTDKIKEAAAGHGSDINIWFKYNETTYLTAVNSKDISPEYFGNSDFTWNAVNENSISPLISQCLRENKLVLVWSDKENQSSVTYSKVEAKDPTCTEKGNIEYYIGSDSKFYTLKNGVYTEIQGYARIINPTGHNYGTPDWEMGDDLTVRAEFICKNCGDKIIKKAEVTSEIVKEPTYTTSGKITYNARVDFNGNIHSYSTTKTIPKLKLTHVEAAEPTCTAAGNIGYWYDEKNDRYFSDDKGENEITKADTVIKAGHTAGSPVVENRTEPTYFEAGGYDEVVYCTECGEELSREHFTLKKLAYHAPAIKFIKGENSVKLSWTEVDGADKYGIAGYVNGKWQLLYDNLNDTSFILNGLSEGKEYWVAVIAKSEGRWITDFSNAIVVSAKSTEGKYPVLRSVEHNADTHQFKLKWSEVKGAEQYGIAVWLSGKWKVVKQDIPAGTTSFISPKLTAGQTYKMVIAAKVGGKWDTNNLAARSFSVTVQPEEKVPTGAFESEDFKFSGNVYIVGDSTVCDYKPESTQKKGSCGWGMKLAEQFEGVTVNNLARAGRSSRSFMNDNEYATMCNSIGKGDYLFIQFGHNDERTAEPQHSAYPNLDLSTLDKDGKNADGQYSYEWVLLNKYVKVAQAKGATAVLVTPVTRRAKDGRPQTEEHQRYADAIIQLGKTYNIPVIDMTSKTRDLYNEIFAQGGAEATAELHCFLDETRKEIDNTHLSVKGCELIADILAEETKTLGLKISEKLK